MNTSPIEGLWHSRYEYGQGPDNLPQASEDIMHFSPVEGGCMGVSAPNQEGSGVLIWLKQNDAVFSGNWRVDTAPKGHYEGKRFEGLLMLVLSADRDTLEGEWLGPNTANDRIKSGLWIFTRLTETT